MFAKLSRQLSRYVVHLKLLGILLSALSLALVVISTPPSPQTMFLFFFFLFLLLFLLFYIFFKPGVAALVSGIATGLLILRALGLLSPVTIGLLIIFFALLTLYFRKSSG